MSVGEILFLSSLLPIASFLIAWWVLRESKKITAQAHARAARAASEKR